MRTQVVIIGAGPSGAIAGALLARQGRDVLILERQQFPRFSIGESLLAHCLDFIDEAGMMPAVQRGGFQLKNGAAFARGDEYVDFDFGDAYTPGRTFAYQVQRATFDQILADEAQRLGAQIRYQWELRAVEPSESGVSLTVARADGVSVKVTADFVLDASGFARVLPRLLDLERPSGFPVRQAIFTHVADGIAGDFDRNKIRVTVHGLHPDVWFWLIPFSGGRSSLGVVATREFLSRYPGPPDAQLRRILAEDGGLSGLLAAAQWDTPVREIVGYAANVKAMHGPGFALLGNAAEFLDPVFSSGVTIAMRSASTAARLLARQLHGEAVDWDTEYERPLRRGIDCFRAYVDAWYDGRFQNVIFRPDRSMEIQRKICSILAGYAWDTTNPFVAEPRRRLDALAAFCSS